MARSLALGVDIGGSKVAAGLVNSEGHILSKTRLPMVTTGTAADGFAAVTGAVDAVLLANLDLRESLLGIGVCSPGPLDPRMGVVINPPNLPCWRDFPLAAKVRRAFGFDVRVDNDANAAALAEAVWGVGVGHQSIFYATLGTGIGTGIVFEQRIYHGRTGSAAEGGHVTIDYRGPQCACGKRGCIEALASGTALAQRARQRVAEAQLKGSPPRAAASSELFALASRPAEAITAETVERAHLDGDPIATELLAETAEYLAIWLGSIIDLLEPDLIVIGGGMSKVMEPWFEQIRDRLPAWCLNQRCLEIPLRRAVYGEDAGLAGAAALWHQPDQAPRSSVGSPRGAL